MPRRGLGIHEFVRNELVDPKPKAWDDDRERGDQRVQTTEHLAAQNRK
jgi:hypothetical protein